MLRRARSCQGRRGDAVDTVPSHVWLSATGRQFCMNSARIAQEDNKTGSIFVIFTKKLP
jgi:hypothetical protein